MKFPNFREFSGNSEELTKWIKEELTIWLKELTNGFKKLNFADNFDTFEVQLTIAASTELPIRNQLRSGLIPTKWFIIRGDQYSINVADGPTSWTSSYVYLKNYGGSDTTLTVLFMR